MFPQVSHYLTLLTFSRFSITLREGEARESWRAVDQHEVDKIKRTPIAQWGFGASRLIETAEKVVKVCRMLCWRCHGNIDLGLRILPSVWLV